MALCPTGQKTTIEWQYPGEDKQRIIGADDYTIEQNFVNEYPCISTVAWRADPNPNTPASGILTGTFEFSVDVDEVVLIKQDKLPGNNACPHIPQRIFITSRNRVLLPYAATCHTVTKVNETIVCNGGYVFTITKNGVTVYQQSLPVAPTVNYFCGSETCPSGTCECDCGSEVCCYDSVTGAVIKTFRK